MIVSGIGKQPGGTGLVGALRDCHERIRRFSGLARKLADSPEAPPAELAELAGRIRFYFENGLPEHVRDEEESLLPRLQGKSAELDQALQAMAGEHQQHSALLGRLLELLAIVQASPARLAEVAGELRPLSAAIERDFTAHLELEERVVFPAVAALPANVQANIQQEGRARRGSAPA